MTKNKEVQEFSKKVGKLWYDAIDEYFFNLYSGEEQITKTKR